MKHPLLLLLLLLWTAAAFHLESHAPHLDSQETQADLSQDLEGSGDQEGEPALTEEDIQSEGEQAEVSSCQNDSEDEEATEFDPNALDNDVQCPRTEDTVQITGSPECKTCHYILVRSHQTFQQAKHTCRACYRGNLVSIHDSGTNYLLQRLTCGLNSGQVWVGGIRRPCPWGRRFFWIDGSCWNYANWAAGHPRCGRGRCVALCTRGGHWRRVRCVRHLPFLCRA